jgi:hypothetical protein
MAHEALIGSRSPGCHSTRVDAYLDAPRFTVIAPAQVRSHRSSSRPTPRRERRRLALGILRALRLEDDHRAQTIRLHLEVSGASGSGCSRQRAIERRLLLMDTRTIAIAAFVIVVIVVLVVFVL